MNDKPYLSNYPELENWLEKHGARCQFQTTTDRKPLSETNNSVEMWITQSGVAVMVVIYGRGHGWDLFTPCANPSIGASFEDADARIADILLSRFGHRD